jgi:hypothetical protein
MTAAGRDVSGVFNSASEEPNLSERQIRVEEAVSHQTDHNSPASTALSDLLPALRWGNPTQLGPLLDDPRLPSAWWVRVLLADAIATITADAVAQRAASVLRAHLPHLTLETAMPHLRFCPEGQETDLGQSVEQAVAGMSVADGDALLSALVHAQLRPFRHGGRNLDEPSAVQPHGREPALVPVLGELTAALLQLLPPEAPAEVRQAAQAVHGWAQRIATAPAETPADAPAPISPDGTGTPAPSDVQAGFASSPLAVLRELIGAWDERQLAIAAARMFASDRIALEVLGERFSVTRERIRQIQISLEKQVQQWPHVQLGRTFHGHLLAVQNALGPVATDTELKALHDEHTRTVPGLDLPLWQVLACCLPDRQWAQGWVVEGDLRDRQEHSRAALQQRCSSQTVLSWNEAVRLLADFGIREEGAQAWLEDLGGFRIVDDSLLSWGRSVNERAEAILSLAGQPLPAAELLSRLDDGTALVSLRNQLQTDERFLRRDRDLYGLRCWGGPEYLGIREMIVRELEAAEGQARAEDIVSALCSQFDVSDKSVHAYLSGPGFERFQRGWVRLATPDTEDGADYQPRRDVSQTRRCFQTGQGNWWYRLDVNRDHLRGSGFPVPSGFAVHLDLTPGNKIELPHQVGEATVAWGNQPTFGSLRPLLESLGAVEGDHVFLAVKDGNLKAQRIAQEADAELTHTQRALRLMALSGDVAEAAMPSVVGRRIGLADATTMEEVYAHLRQRGDKDILMLLQPGPETAADVADETPPPLPAAAPVPADGTAQLATEYPTTPGDVGAPASDAISRDSAWDAEIIPLLAPETEAPHIALAQALADLGKAAPVFGYELGDGGWQADFAWDGRASKIAVVSDPVPSSGGAAEAAQRDAAYRDMGWTIDTATGWLARLAELADALPDASPQG